MVTTPQSPPPRQIVIIAPSDVEDEVDTIRGIIDLANSFRPEQPIRPWYWRRDATPGLHVEGPQGVTDEQMRISSADLVIAIFWTRLGTPVGTESSGTLHELNLAWDSWRSIGTPAVWIYFCKRPIPQDALEDSGQFSALRSFRSNLPREQSFWEFTDPDDLETIFANHLGNWLQRNAPSNPPTLPDSEGVLVPPDASRTITRNDQLSHLRRAFAGSPIVCLHGIAGSGKTRLAAQYVSSRQRIRAHSYQPLWYDVADEDTLDDMLSVFPIEYVGSSISSLNRSKTLLATLKLRSQLLVLDDFHRANRVSYAPLLQVARFQPAPSPLLLLSRIALFIPDSIELAVRAWSAPEVSALLEHLGGPELSQSLLTQLTEKTGGLPLAISFFSTLVNQLGHDPNTLLQGELTQTHLTEQWYAEIKAQLTDSELLLLRYFSLAEPYITTPVLNRAEARLRRQERSRAFTRLQTLLLIESRGSSRWAVHPFVAEHTLNDTDDELINRFLRDLSNFSRSGIQNLRPAEITQRSLAAGIRACRYAQRAKDTAQSAAIIRHICGAAKRLGYYRPLRDLCLWHITVESECDPWIKYHYAHCQLILGELQIAVTVLATLQSPDRGSALTFAVARLLAEARSQIGNPETAIIELRRVLAHHPDASRGAMSSYAQARSTLVGLLIETDELSEASLLAIELAREAHETHDERGLAKIAVQLGQIEAHSSLRNAERRFRVAVDKFRSVGDRRGLAWALRNLAKTLLALDGDSYSRARRPAREAMAICSRIGESTTEYGEWLEAVRFRFLNDLATLSLIDRELFRVSNDMGLQ